VAVVAWGIAIIVWILLALWLIRKLMVAAHMVRVVGSRARDAREEREIFRRVATEKAIWDLEEKER
jgi:hypothetical protein